MFTVYLIHFDSLLSNHAAHYLGYTRDIESRLARHKSNDGARILMECNLRNIDYRIVRTWNVQSKVQARELEIKLKARKRASKLCLACNPKSAIQNGNFEGVQSEFICECNHNTVSNSNLPLMVD